MARLGSIGTQYFDDAGDPLIDGKLYFYESGTNTDKTTYKDVNQSIPNTNPVILSGSGRQPNIFFTGSARVIITGSDDVQIEVRDPIGGEAEEGVFSPWNTLTIYNIPDIVVGSDGNFYISITDGNQNNDPVSDPSNWTQIRFIRVWNINETYGIGQVVEASDNFLYASLTDNNLGNNPIGDEANWQSASNLDIPNVVLSAGYQFAYNNF